MAEEGSVLYLEYHPNLYVTLESPVLVRCACEMVAGYHNHLREFLAPEVWGSSLDEGVYTCGMPSVLSLGSCLNPDSDQESDGSDYLGVMAPVIFPAVMIPPASDVRFASRLRKYMPAPVTIAVIEGGV